MRFETDVFVLGGGPAGLAAAIAARRAGLRVVLADAARPPIDKACGEGLMPDSLAAAAQLGIHLDPSQGFSFPGIRFVGDGHTVSAKFPNGAGLGVRRTVLHPQLIEQAERAGVDLRWGTSVTSLDRIRQTARWIIGADGSQSSVRRWAGLTAYRRNSRRYSYRRHYAIAPWSDCMEIHWSQGFQFYVTPVRANQICLVLMTHNSHQRIDAALPSFPILQTRLAHCEPASSERGAIAATHQLRSVTRDNVALIGDASGTVDPITGDGLCLAFHQAVALADALFAGDLNIYERAHARLARRPRFMGDFMLLLDRSSALRRRSLAAFESKPDLFANILAMHVGQLNPARFLATAAMLGWRVVTA